MSDAENEDGFPEVTVTELELRIRNGNVPTLVDVREPFEREIADLPEVGQLRIPLGDLSTRLSEFQDEPEVVLYCRSGSRSGRATLALRRMGMDNVFNLRGGLLAWSDDVDPSVQKY